MEEEEGRGGLLALLVGNKNLERRDKVSHGHAGILLPLLESLYIVDKDEKVVCVALEVDLRLGALALGHLGFFCNTFDGGMRNRFYSQRASGIILELCSL